MPVNRGQGQTTRWYQLCFVPSSGDNSDDSDTESVILAHSTPIPTTTTWQELSAPESSSPLPPPNPEPQIAPPPLNPESQIDWPFPPPPPTPPLQNVWELLPRNIESRHDRYQRQQQAQSPSHVLEADHQSVNFLQVPIDVISRVRISELHEIENLSHSQCPICLENFKVGDRACRLPCIHIYCSECILRWLNNNKTCPVCRLQLNDWESQSGSNSIGDDHSLELETEILQMQQPIQTNSVSAWDFYFPPSLVDSSEHAVYYSASDGDSHEDRDYIVGASQSGHS